MPTVKHERWQAYRNDQPAGFWADAYAIAWTGEEGPPSEFMKKGQFSDEFVEYAGVSILGSKLYVKLTAGHNLNALSNADAEAPTLVLPGSPDLLRALADRLGKIADAVEAGAYADRKVL